MPCCRGNDQDTSPITGFGLSSYKARGYQPIHRTGYCRLRDLEMPSEPPDCSEVLGRITHEEDRHLP